MMIPVQTRLRRIHRATQPHLVGAAPWSEYLLASLTALLGVTASPQATISPFEPSASPTSFIAGQQVQSCEANSACTVLPGNCCPNEFGQFLPCCNGVWLLRNLFRPSLQSIIRLSKVSLRPASSRNSFSSKEELG